jgi:hypothetical protein
MKTKNFTYSAAWALIGMVLMLFACRPARHTVVYTQPEHQVVVERQRTHVIYVKDQSQIASPAAKKTEE